MSSTGKTGKGKTTLLHILANLCELDLKRFSWLAYKSIAVTTFGGDTVVLEPNGENDLPKVFLNGRKLGQDDDLNGLPGIEELEELRSTLGGQATYLPAFRSVLERSKRNVPYWHSENRDNKEFEEIMKSEELLLKRLSTSNISSRAGNREEAASIADKTVRCRHWFGNFTPVIRYPSIADVEMGLGEEWRTAEVQITHREQTLFEDTFLRIFRTITGVEPVISESSREDILQEIISLLEQPETFGEEQMGPRAYDHILSVAQEMDQAESDTHFNSLFEIYREALASRNEQRRQKFQRLKDFQKSANLFLDDKKIKFAPTGSRPPYRRRVVSILSGNGHNYDLTALSSGERQILTMLYSASRTRFRGGAFLIDEPELSLHIDWQRIILSQIQSQEPGRQIVVCTHSPEVGGDHMEVTQDFEPSPHQSEDLSEIDIEDLYFDED